MIQITKHSAPVPHLPEELRGLRVVQISDLHRSPKTPDHLIRAAVETANHACPDLLLLTGDFVTERAADIAPCMEMLSDLQARLGIYASLGNHDHKAGAKKVTQALEDLGITVLNNSSTRLDNGLRLVGLDDYKWGKPNAREAFEGVGPNEPTLVLSHNPIGIEDISDRACLMFSGHTHGGQINIPLLAHYAVWRTGAKHYKSGWFRVGKARVYVNRGIGMVGTPIRFWCRSEVSLFTLEPAPSS